MNIKPIKGFPTITDSKINKKPGNTDSEKQADKVSISTQAREMNNKTKIDKLSKIKERIAAKDYDSDDVMRSVAGKILKEIKQTEKK